VSDPGIFPPTGASIPLVLPTVQEPLRMDGSLPCCIRTDRVSYLIGLAKFPDQELGIGPTSIVLCVVFWCQTLFPPPLWRQR